MDLKKLISEIPDFPIKGVSFKDINPLLRSPEALEIVSQKFGRVLNCQEADMFAGIESRGFILAALLAGKYGKGFLPIRKSGKLPPPVHQESYSLEYGEATIEVQPGQGKIIIMDDVLATGGTLNAALRLCQVAGYQVIDVGVLINLTFLNQMRYKHKEIPSLVQY